jgi:hypothetical protein
VKEWYIARGNKKYGPYTVDEIIQLRQQGKAFESDLVWRQGLRLWKPLIQTEEFSPHAMAERVGKAESCELFNRRQWPRVRKHVPVLVHNDLHLWTARTVTISQGGALIELNTPYLHPGHQVQIHFKSQGEDEKQFSCLGQITGKRFSHDRIRFNTSLQYSVRFEKMDPGAEEQLEYWVRQILSEKMNKGQGVSNVTVNS